LKIFLVYSRAYKHILREENVPILVNYAYLGRKGNIKIPPDFPSVMIDSGGYQLQVKVSAVREPRVDAYSFWLENEVLPKHKEIAGYMNLDIFSLDMVGKPIKEKIDSLKRSAESTLKNQEIMENKFGLKPIPIWHAGEPEEHFKHYCENYDYVAIGGIASLGTPSKSSIMNLLVFAMQKYPKVKFHLFGIGISGLLAFKSLKPYSVDFSTWNVPARFGHQVIEDDKQLLKEIKLSVEERDRIRQDNDLEANYLRETIRKIKKLEKDLESYQDPYQKLLF